MKTFLLVVLLSILGCTSPTPYQEARDEKAKGFSDKIVEGELRIAEFRGNEKMDKKKAELFAKFRSIEVCSELGRPYTHMLLVQDRTRSETGIQSSAVAPTYYYYGMAPYYGHHGYMNPGPTTVSTQSVTYTYPAFEIYFECVDRPYDARIAFHNITGKQVEALVKDLMGAVQVDEVLKDSPNSGKIQKADIITRLDDKRVTKVLDLYRVSRETSQTELRVEYIRNGKFGQTVLRRADVSGLVGEAQHKIIKEACDDDEIKHQSKLCKK